jgi:hypothetical protein
MQKGYYPDLTALKALAGVTPGHFAVVIDYDGGNVPAMYVFYSGIPGGAAFEPNVVLADDNSGYWLLLSASPVSANT